MIDRTHTPHAAYSASQRRTAAVPPSTAAGLHARHVRGSAITGRLRAQQVPIRRGACVVDHARFVDACEGLTPAIVRAEKVEAHRRDRAELRAIGWVVVGLACVLLPFAAFVAAFVAACVWIGRHL